MRQLLPLILTEWKNIPKKREGREGWGNHCCCCHCHSHCCCCHSCCWHCCCCCYHYQCRSCCSHCQCCCCCCCHHCCHCWYPAHPCWCCTHSLTLAPHFSPHLHLLAFDPTCLYSHPHPHICTHSCSLVIIHACWTLDHATWPSFVLSSPHSC